eukprot:SAG31_NODE_15000_length_776_cov_1.314623_2_plen_70_part_01
MSACARAGASSTTGDDRISAVRSKSLAKQICKACCSGIKRLSLCNKLVVLLTRNTASCIGLRTSIDGLTI